jgi:hypothetical protein
MERTNALNGRPIAGKIVAKMTRRLRNKVINIGDVVDGRATAEELHQEIRAKKELAGLDPAFAAYVYPQIQVSVMSEQLTGLKEMAPFADIVSKAEDLYMPEGPPMSPLTRSYFTCWALFDACVGPANETIGTTILDIGAAFGMHAELLRLIRLMQESRMGLYIHRGRRDRLTVLEDIVTGAVYRAIVPSGDCGKKGELWYARVLPPPTPGGQEYVVFTTPYIVLHPKLPDWREYFRRTIPATAPADDYERHMKYGPTRQYWNDFVFEAYVNHRTEAIYLAGLPDVPESRPHSRVSEENGWKDRPDFIVQR